MKKLFIVGAVKFYMYSKNNKQRNHISNILKKLMKEARIKTIADLSKLCGVKQHTINKILSGGIDSPRADTVNKFAKVFNLSIEHLIGEVPIPEYWSTGMKQNEVASTSWVYVPIIDWHDSLEWKTLKKNFTPHTHREWVSSEQKISPSTFALRTKNFMEPHFNAHSIILIDPEKIPLDKQYVIVSIDNDAPTIRKLLKEGKKSYLESISPHFSTRPLSSKDLVLGPIIECRVHF